MRPILFLAACGLALCSESAVAELMPLDTAAKLFGTRETSWAPELSPSGKQMLFFASGDKGRTTLLLKDFGTGENSELLFSTGLPEHLEWCDFATEVRIICEFRGNKADGQQIIGFSRLIAVSSDTREIKPLGNKTSGYDAYVRQYDGAVVDWRADASGSVLIARNYVPQVDLGPSGLTDTSEGLGVDRLNLATFRWDSVEPPKGQASAYLSDGHGRIRVMALEQVESGQQLTGVTELRFRRPGSREWNKLGEYDWRTGSGCWPVALGNEGNSVYCLENTAGHDALFTVAIDGTGTQTLVAKNDKVDIDGVVQLDRGMPVIGYRYTDDRSRIVYFDPEYRKLADSLSKALPNAPLISFASAASDRNTLLVHASSDADPGAYYLLNRQSRHMEPVLLSRAALEDHQLAPMKAITYPAADGTAIPAYITIDKAAGRNPGPAIILPHGGPSARDSWGFDWLAQFFAARGYLVIQPNYRGSSGYGSDFQGDNAFRDWRTAMSDIDDAATYLVAQGLADPTRIAITGWSYGGYAALQSAVMHPDRYKAVVAIAPVTDLNELKRDARGYTNARLTKQIIGPSEGAANGSPLQSSDRIVAPVLLVHGDLDDNVRITHSLKMTAALKKSGRSVELLRFRDLDHQLDDSEARIEMLTKIGELLERTIGH